MSMILDALKRSRDDSRRGQGVPSVDTEHFAARERAGPSPWLIGIVLVGAVVIVVLVTLLLGSQDSAEEAIAASGSPPTQGGPASSGEAGDPEPQEPTGASGYVELPAPERTGSNKAPVSAAPATSSETPEALTSEVAALYGNGNRSGERGSGEFGGEEQEAPAQNQLSHTAGGTAANRASDSPDADKNMDALPAAQTPNEQSDSTVAGDDELPINIEEVLRRAQAELGEDRLLPHETPLLAYLSQQKKDKVPSVLYSVHDWESGGQASVVLNGKTLTEGQRHDGFLVKEILSDSVILSWGGIDFRLRALNSWVNL